MFAGIRQTLNLQIKDNIIGSISLRQKPKLRPTPNKKRKVQKSKKSNKFGKSEKKSTKSKNLN